MIPAEVLPFVRLAGLNRFAWVVGVGASGTGRGGAAVAGFLRSAAAYVAANYCISLVDEGVDGVPHNVRSNPHFEQIRRIFSSEIRFAWISHLIIRCALEEAAQSPEDYSSLGWLDPIAADHFFDWIRVAVVEGDSTAGQEAWRALPYSALGLASALSSEAGSRANEAFETLIFSTDMERRPLLMLKAGDPPLVLREGVASLEVAFMELLREELKEEKKRSDLYEAVLLRAAKQVAPPGLIVCDPPMEVATAGSPNRGEVDFAFSAPQNMLLIGEAKALFVVKDAGTVINAFADQVGKAVSQLSLRLQRLADGSALSTASGSIRVDSSTSLHGIAAPLHSYASAVWNRDSLSEVAADRADISVIPAHHLVMLLQTVSDIGDLRQYLQFRASLILANTQIWDEADLLVSYLSTGKAEVQARSLLMSTLGTKPVLRERWLPFHVALGARQPTSRRDWRRLIYEATVRPDRTALLG
jgi:hypothetical protein